MQTAAKEQKYVCLRRWVGFSVFYCSTKIQLQTSTQEACFLVLVNVHIHPNDRKVEASAYALGSYRQVHQYRKKGPSAISGKGQAIKDAAAESRCCTL